MVWVVGTSLMGRSVRDGISGTISAIFETGNFRQCPAFDARHMPGSIVACNERTEHTERLEESLKFEAAVDEIELSRFWFIHSSRGSITERLRMHSTSFYYRHVLWHNY